MPMATKPPPHAALRPLIWMVWPAMCRCKSPTPVARSLTPCNWGAANPGRNYFTWDGSNYDGDVSNLQFKVVATNGQDTVQSSALAPQAVVGTSITDQGMVLELANGKSIGYSNVKAVF